MPKANAAERLAKIRKGCFPWGLAMVTVPTGRASATAPWRKKLSWRGTKHEQKRWRNSSPQCNFLAAAPCTALSTSLDLHFLT